MVRVCRPLRTPTLTLRPTVRTDRACGTTQLSGVRHVWGPGDRPRVCRLCGEAQPRIITARLMVSLPVHVSCFDLFIVYTNMSGVTHSYRDSELLFWNSNTTRCADYHFVWEYTRLQMTFVMMRRFFSKIDRNLSGGYMGRPGNPLWSKYGCCLRLVFGK